MPLRIRVHHMTGEPGTILHSLAPRLTVWLVTAPACDRACAVSGRDRTPQPIRVDIARCAAHDLRNQVAVEIDITGVRALAGLVHKLPSLAVDLHLVAAALADLCATAQAVIGVAGTGAARSEAIGLIEVVCLSAARGEIAARIVAITDRTAVTQRGEAQSDACSYAHRLYY